MDILDQSVYNESRRPYVLFVTIVAARGLPQYTTKGISNPFVRIKYGNQRFQTQVVTHNRNIIQSTWNESFIFNYQQNLVATCSVYDSVSFARPTIIGDAELQTPQHGQPIAKWYSITGRERTLLDFGRHVVNYRSHDSLGQIFVASLLLDPLELTEMSQSIPAALPVPSDGSDAIANVEAMALENFVPTVRFAVETNIPVPNSNPGSGRQTSNTEIVSMNRVKKNRRKSYRHQSIDSTIALHQIWNIMKSIRLRLLASRFYNWKCKTDLSAIVELKPEATKMQLLQCKYKLKKADNRILQLEKMLTEMQSNKISNELAALRANETIQKEIAEAVSRAEIAESLVLKLEAEIMGYSSEFSTPPPVLMTNSKPHTFRRDSIPFDLKLISDDNSHEDVELDARSITPPLPVTKNKVKLENKRNEIIWPIVMKPRQLPQWRVNLQFIQES